MQGLWKTKVSGWNQKDSKRKKQNINHLIKDNIKELRKTLKGKYIENENISMYSFESVYHKDKYSGYIIENKKLNLYLIKIKFVNRKKEIKEILIKGFFVGYSNKTLIDLQSKKEFCDAYDINNDYSFTFSSNNILEYTIVKDLGYVKSIDFDLKEVKDIFHNGFKYNLKYHNKNIEHYYIKEKLVTYRYEAKTSKNLQNFTNRENRTLVRNYIKNGNFEKEYKLPFKNKHNKWYNE